MDIFTLLYPLSPLSPSLWETARYRLKYCLKGPLNPKQPTNQPEAEMPLSRLKWGRSGGAKVLGKLPVLGRPTNLGYSRARAYYACSRCGRGLFGHFFLSSIISLFFLGGGRVVQRCWVNFQCRGVLLIWLTVGQGPTALAVGAGGGCLDIFYRIYHFSFLSPSLWETARYRLKYCLKGPLSPKTINQSIFSFSLCLGDGPI